MNAPTIHTILNNTGNGHIVWYKDEGGNDHGLDVSVTLIDANSESNHAVSDDFMDEGGKTDMHSRL